MTSDEIENYDLDDQFIMVMEAFHKKANPKMKKFNMTVGNVMTSTKRVMRKYSFGTEDSPQTIEAFFGIWYKFFEDFRGAKEKLIQLEKERQKRIAKRKKMKEKEKRKMLHQQYSKRNLGGDDEDRLTKGSSLYREFEKRQKFEKNKEKLHGKLTGHVKKKSIFVQNGGKLDGQTQNETMRRLSSMYQNDMDQVKALEDARKKAAIMKYNKFRLPEPKSNPSKWTDYKKLTGKDSNFDLDRGDKPMLKPMNKPRRNVANKQVSSAPPNVNAMNGLNGAASQRTAAQNGVPSPRNKPKQKPKGFGNSQHNGVHGKQGQLPPPPNSSPPANAMNVRPVQMGYSPQNNYGYNPQAQWQQQQQQPLGYGSSPNLNYNQFQQNNMGNAAMYAQQQQPPQGQYRPNQMQPFPNQYHPPPPSNNQKYGR